MRINLLLITTIVVLFQSIEAVEKFCDRERKLMLSGVFNLDNILFAYSWKDVNDVKQNHLVWRYRIKGKQLIEMGDSLTVETVLPEIPLFRAGFGLSLKCDSSDAKCNLYNNLVFIFFQNFYKVFRFADHRFSDEPNTGNIPWRLQSRGYAKQFGFDRYEFDHVDAAVFMPGQQPQIFIVFKNILCKSAVDIRAQSLKWTKLTESKIFTNILGAFISDSELFFNRKEPPETSGGVVFKYDTNSGEETQKTEVWNYFGCTVTDENTDRPSGNQSNGKNNTTRKKRLDVEEVNNRYAAIIISIIIIAIIISNTSAALFWLTVGKLKCGRKYKV